MSGDWKRLKRIAGGYKGLSEPAYTVKGDHLSILLASDTCDAYDNLEGELRDGRFTGRHSRFGLGWSKDIGSASAIQVE